LSLSLRRHHLPEVAALLGQAGADVAAAGFNTCALYNDLTTAIPNAVGTGLPCNCLDCAGDSDTSSISHWGVNDRNRPFSTDTAPCARVIANATDPVYGNRALDLASLYSDLVVT
jgi:hypothetical protein